MDEDVFLEDRLFPWLADDSMSDATIGIPLGGFDDGHYDDDPAYYCDCGCGLDGSEVECPDCGLAFAGGE